MHRKKDLLCRALALNPDIKFDEAIQEYGLPTMINTRFTHEENYIPKKDPFLSVAIATGKGYSPILFEAAFYRGKIAPGSKLYIFTAEVPVIDLIPAFYEDKSHSPHDWWQRSFQTAEAPDSQSHYTFHYQYNEYLLAERLPHTSITKVESFGAEELALKLPLIETHSTHDFILAKNNYKKTESFVKLEKLATKAQEVIELFRSYIYGIANKTNWPQLFEIEKLLEEAISQVNQLNGSLDENACVIPSDQRLLEYEQAIYFAQNLVKDYIISNPDWQSSTP